MNGREFSSLLDVTGNTVKGVVLTGLILGYMLVSIPITILKELRVLPGDKIND